MAQVGEYLPSQHRVSSHSQYQEGQGRKKGAQFGQETASVAG
jgi:hypothetical protein